MCSGLIRGINDIGKFQTGQDAIKGITGRYQAGFFPIMMFGMPRVGDVSHRESAQKNKYMVGL